MSHHESPLALPAPPSELEATMYYVGLRAILVARSSNVRWEYSYGPWPRSKELRPVGNHPFKEVWEDNLAFKLHALLDSMEVKWTSTDVVRIGDTEESFAPVILWIGVVPKTLSGEDGVVVATKCRDILMEYDIADVDVEIRESVVTRSAGPRLLPPTRSSLTAKVREPLTTTLGLPICAQSTPWADGTGGFFIVEGENPERLLLVTARHVVFAPDENEHFEHTNDIQRQHNVMLFGDDAFSKYLESIKLAIFHQGLMVDYHERCLQAIEEGDGLVTDRRRQKAQDQLDEARDAVKELQAFSHDISIDWATPESRVLGHVILSPPISAGIGTEGYADDWAVIEIDASKIDLSNFAGNAIDLGTRIKMDDFMSMMHPNRSDPYFHYPYFDRLLRLKGTIPDEELRNPTTLDQYDNPCITVIKRGNSTGVTVGRANNIYSYTRFYCKGAKVTSKEWPILSRSSSSGVFSDQGDSGAVIVDGLGRIGGLITSGAGNSAFLDITYATPISFLLRRMQHHGLQSPNVNHPVLTTKNKFAV